MSERVVPRPTGTDQTTIRSSVASDERYLADLDITPSEMMADLDVAQARALLDVIDRQRARITDLEADLTEHRRIRDHVNDQIDWFHEAKKAHAEAERLTVGQTAFKAELARLRAVLAVYADPTSYRETPTDAGDVLNEPWIWGDQGDEAREALNHTAVSS